MKRLFLTSSIGTPGVAISIKNKLSDLSSFKTAFITTPVEPLIEKDDLSWLDQDRSAMKVAGFNVFDYTITGKNLNQITKELNDVDMIYVSGGNTNFMLEQSQKTRFIDYIKTFVNNGMPYISTSAGSIISGPSIPPYLWGDEAGALSLTDFSGYNLVNFTVIPHWGSEWFRDSYLHGRMSQIYSKDLGKFILLNDFQYVEVQDSALKIVDVRHSK